MKRRHILLQLAMLSGIVAFSTAARQEVFSRKVAGTVYDARNRPLPSAIVYLNNLRTHRIRTYVSDRRGQYHFAGLKSYDDYEIHAEHEGMTSDKKTISKTEVKNTLMIDLRVDKRK